MYIVFEGIDTVGKSTQIDLIRSRHPDGIYTHEPGGTAFGRQARAILLEDTLHSRRAELLLFLADRAEHYDEVVAPHRGGWVISDRGFLSGIAYALANGDCDFEELLRLNLFALGGQLPDKIILFLTDRDTLTERASARQLDGIERRGLAYLMAVQKHMRESVEKLGVDYLLVDATEPIEIIHQKIVSYLQL